MQEVDHAERVKGGPNANEQRRNSTIIELRRYHLQPGARETLIDLFEREFIESQEEAGMNVIGQFRDLDDPDSFVWLRGFTDMASRSEGLVRFYGGPVWAAHAGQANETMINSDNVLLLCPASPEGGFSVAPATQRPPRDASGGETGLVLCTVCYLPPRTEADFAAFFEQEIRPMLSQCGASVLATLISEHNANGFPRLPVREGETVFAWLSAFACLQDYLKHVGRIAGSESWRHALTEMQRRAWRQEHLRLVPTARSLLGASAGFPLKSGRPIV